MHEYLLFVLTLLAWIAFLYVLVRRDGNLRLRIAELEAEVNALREGGRGRPEEISTKQEELDRLNRSLWMNRFGLSVMGPFLMLKTLRGRQFIERLSHARRFWKVFGDACIAIVIFTMVFMMVLLVWTATIVSRIPADRAPAPQNIIGLPGINPIIPVGYGIFALAVAIVAHEFSHGILARLAKVRINSLGVLLLVVPMGAFVEPDEGELKTLDKRARGRMFAAGPGVNIILALVTLGLFSLVMMPSVTPVAQGAGIAAVIAAPAEGNLEPGMVITAVNGTRVRAVAEFERAMALTRANQTVEVAVYRKGEGELHFSLTLTDKYAATNREADRGKGLLGVRPASTETSIYNPFAVSSFPDFLRASLTLIFLPFTGLVPIQDPIAQFYSVGGGWGVLPEPFFWLLANTIYWLFWINLMLGMTNALPAVPLDGGYLFKDLFDGFLKRVKANMGLEARERVTRNLSYILALFILALVVWQIIGPRYFGAGP